MKSDRTSCRSANANQMRLILHTAAYWLMWKLRQVAPATVRLRLIKVAARVVETASRIRIAFASACPAADIFRHIARALKPAPT
ncbi:IS1380 family transposase [Sphingobium sp. BS19]|nr:IS1380 family transposase [Sphingobium sp. BS19]